MRAFDRHSLCRRAFIYNSSRLRDWRICHTSCAFPARSRQTRLPAPAGRSLLSPAPVEIRISEGLIARISRSPSERLPKRQLPIYMCVTAIYSGSRSHRVPQRHSGIRAVFLTVSLEPEPGLARSRRAGNVCGLILPSPPPSWILSCGDSRFLPGHRPSSARPGAVGSRSRPPQHLPPGASITPDLGMSSVPSRDQKTYAPRGPLSPGDFREGKGHFHPPRMSYAPVDPLPLPPVPRP